MRAPLGSLFDVDHLVAWAASADAVLHAVRAGLGFGLGLD